MPCWRGGKWNVEVCDAYSFCQLGLPFVTFSQFEQSRLKLVASFKNIAAKIL